MSTRNPMNERNQEGAKKGVTRKSAASAKPKQKAASSVYVRDPNYKPKKKLSERIFGGGDQPQELSKNQQRKQAQKQAQLDAQREETKQQYKEKRKKKRYTLLDMENETRSIENLSEEDKKAAEARYRNPGTRAYKKWRAIWFILIGLGLCTLIPPIVANEAFVDNEGLSTIFYVLGWLFIATAVAVDALRIRPLRKNARYGRSTDNSKQATRARKQAKAKVNQERAAARKKAAAAAEASKK